MVQKAATRCCGTWCSLPLYPGQMVIENFGPAENAFGTRLDHLVSSLSGKNLGEHVVEFRRQFLTDLCSILIADLQLKIDFFAIVLAFVALAKGYAAAKRNLSVLTQILKGSMCL
jgi:hypothetical protein